MAPDTAKTGDIVTTRFGRKGRLIRTRRKNDYGEILFRVELPECEKGKVDDWFHPAALIGPFTLGQIDEMGGEITRKGE